MVRRRYVPSSYMRRAKGELSAQRELTRTHVLLDKTPCLGRCPLTFAGWVVGRKCSHLHFKLPYSVGGGVGKVLPFCKGKGEMSTAASG